MTRHRANTLCDCLLAALVLTGSATVAAGKGGPQRCAEMIGKHGRGA